MLKTCLQIQQCLERVRSPPAQVLSLGKRSGARDWGPRSESHRKGRGSRSPAATRGSRPPWPEVVPLLQRPEPGGGVGSWSPGLGCHCAAGRGRRGARLGLELQVRGGAG